jgi:hypothetical protein
MLRAMPARRSPAALLVLLLAACSGEPPPRHPPPVPLATPLAMPAGAPFPAGCNPPTAGATVFVGAEVEPHLAVDPSNDAHLVAAWQQDRWRGGGSDGHSAAVSVDGGRTWTAAAPLRLTRCSGATGLGSYERASDPWLAVAADGTVHHVALVFDDPWHDSRQAVVTTRSGDGGLSWAAPVVLAADTSADVGLDKPTITADPTRPGHVYAVWDRLTGLSGVPSLSTGPTWLSRSLDGGATWEAAKAIFDPGADAQTISNQIVTTPDGTLVDMFLWLERMSTRAPIGRVAVLRSVDAGVTWSAPIPIADWNPVGTRDPRDGHEVRDGAAVPGVAVDRGDGTIYVAWQDGRFSGGAHDGIALSRSTDAGLVWSAPVQVNGAPAAPAFTPALAVALSGRVGVGYYDLRPVVTGSGPGLWTAAWLATSADQGDTWTDAPMGGPFDLSLAPAVPGYFLGDYAGLVGGSDGFTALFAMTSFGVPGLAELYLASP